MAELLLKDIKIKNTTFHLPPEIVDVIKTYTGEGVWRNGKFVNIHKIAKSDSRYSILLKMPKIKQVYNSDINNPIKGCVWFKTAAGKFMVINVLINYNFKMNNLYFEVNLWEMYYNKEVTQRVIH